MALSIDLSKLSNEEKELLAYWKDARHRIAKDIAYVWSGGFRSDIKGMQIDANRIREILVHLPRHYSERWREKYQDAIKDIELLLNHLQRVEAKTEWIRIIEADLRKVIDEVNKIKFDDLQLEEQQKGQVFDVNGWITAFNGAIAPLENRFQISDMVYKKSRELYTFLYGKVCQKILSVQEKGFVDRSAEAVAEGINENRKFSFY